MISDEKVQQLGDALADIYRQYPADDLRKILEYALEHRQMLGYPRSGRDAGGICEKTPRISRQPRPDGGTLEKGKVRRGTLVKAT
jgi:hypothetical protein